MKKEQAKQNDLVWIQDNKMKPQPMPYQELTKMNDTTLEKQHGEDSKAM